MGSTEDARQSGAVATASTSRASSKTGSQSDSKWKGRRVKRFKLIDELGEGAMGRVFLAEDTVLKRNVALKLLPIKHRDGRPNHRTERLVREARSAASLEHPNVVGIYEIDQSGGVHYIAMELVEGGNLERLVQLSGPMEVERACQLVAEAAEALSHAHTRGIVHRDVKPANLLLTRSGRCKVCDFGLALFDDSGDPAGRTRCVGTPYYIAPEVAQGKGATDASDLYSLGCTLFFMLTGRPPFAGASARELMKAHINEPLPDLRQWRPDVPERLVQAIEQACAKHPDDRFDSAERFGVILRTFTIPLANSGSFATGFSGELSGSGVMQEGQLPPISAAQLAAIMPAEEVGAAKQWGSSRLMWASFGTIAAVLLIGVGVWLARQGPQSVFGRRAVVVQPSNQAPAASNPPVDAIAEPPMGENILINGSVDQGLDATTGKIPGWYVADQCKPQVRTVEEGGNTFLRLTNTDLTTTAHADQKVDVDPSWRAVTISGRIRASSFKAGGRGASGVTVVFQDDKRNQVGGMPSPLVLEADAPWTDMLITADVPPGATKLDLQCIISYTLGTMDFDDIRVMAQK